MATFASSADRGLQPSRRLAFALVAFMFPPRIGRVSFILESGRAQANQPIRASGTLCSGRADQRLCLGRIAGNPLDTKALKS